MKLGKPTQFDMLKKVEVVPQLNNTLCAIYRLGYLCAVHGTRCNGSFLAVSDAAMKLGEFPQYSLLKEIKGVPQLRNVTYTIFILGYSYQVHETFFHGNFHTVSW